MKSFYIPDLGEFAPDCGLIRLDQSSNGRFQTNHNGVISITATGDHKVEFIAFADHTLACVNSSLGYPAYYPVHPVSLQKPVKAVLLDLDGTTVRSEEFWMWIIELTTASLLDNPKFGLEESDLTHVSGHSVSEHLQYCVKKYCPDKTIEEARQIYYQHVHREMQAIVEGNGRVNAFTPTPGVREFLQTLKARGVKIGLVTSGLYEKAYPEILSAFQTMGMGDPQAFYDVIITAGFPLRVGEAGTLGELTPKPHPWLFAEAYRVGLGFPFTERNSVVGIDDSGAGICSIRLAGLPTIGFGGGNLVESGTKMLCDFYSHSFEAIIDYLQ